MTKQFNFDEFERYDAKAAEEGVWFEVTDNKKQLHGEFRLAHYDQNSRELKLAQERMRIRHAKALRTGTEDNELMAREIFLEIVLKDWRKVTAGGKEVPFSKEAAEAYFALPSKQFVLQNLALFAGDPNNFDSAEVEDAVKN